ncbi:BCLAF1 and THRAP3 family member 3 [Brachyistius frenatus]|uniref:BCLAF1 and THRAP3 family member 3 n=1 Tax=Brachyistius frenatus TaxID=100188 RepID=UPI0037E8D76B
MSGPRSRSPRYRRFPWEEPDFDAHKLPSKMDGNPPDRSHRPRGGPGEFRDRFREDVHPEGQRRSSPFPFDQQFGHQRHPDQEFHHKKPPAHYDTMRYEDRRLSPPPNGERRREGFRQHFQSFENRGRSPKSPLRLMRERLPPTPKSPPDHQLRESGMSWRREEQGRGRGKFRNFSPGGRSDDQRGAADRERGSRSAQGPSRGGKRENPPHERSLAFKRQRRETDDAGHLGYRKEEDFEEHGYTMDSPRDGFGGGARGNLPSGDVRHSRPLVVEHDHGITGGRQTPRREQFDDRRDPGPDFDRQRTPRPTGSSQERFRMSDSRSEDREGSRDRHFQDNPRDANYHESRRSPGPQERPNTMRYGNRAGPVNHRGRGGTRPMKVNLNPMKRQYNQSEGGRTGQPRSQPRVQQSNQGYQDPPHTEQRHGYQPFREDYQDPVEEEPDWVEEDRPQQWEHDRPGGLDRHPPRDHLDPKMPRQRERAWNHQKNDSMAVVTEETLTIKVDMSRPVKKNSPLCYSSDRQLSLDLVNVGRQRLDFLPMLEHSGTYRETAMHTGTFAQEIITLVHLVKDQYFRDDGVTLNQRFSTPQKSSYSEEEEEVEELTLDERFSLNRGFSLNMNSLPDDNEPLFSRLGPTQQPVRGPGDLRHDLERRRQEKLEGVKVTIQGNSMSQRPRGAVSEPDVEYGDEVAQMDHEGFSNWPDEQNRRQEGKMGPRRGAPNRLNPGPQRRNNRFGNRRQNMPSTNPAGPNW